MALVRMCDTSLDNSTEALLARISALEDKIALGIVSAAPRESAAAKEAATAPMDEPLPIPEDIPPMPFDATPAPIMQSAPQKEAPTPRKTAKRAPDIPKTEEKPATPSARKVLHAFRRFPDVVKKLEATDPSVVAFLRNCKIYTCEEDGKLYLHASDGFALMLLQKQLNKASLANAVNLFAQDKSYTEADIVMESTETAKSSGYEMIDELITAAKEVNPTT
jgi:hypothetical protein